MCVEERLNYLYVGVDPHKQQHTAVALNFFRKKVFEMSFANRPSAFPKLIKKIIDHTVKGEYTTIIFGLEDTHNYGRRLAV